MNQYVEFVGNHPILFAALCAVIAWMIMDEIRRFTLDAKAVSPREVVQMINNSDVLLVDIRDEKDYRKGHILGARNIPLSELTTGTGVISQADNRPIIAYCDAGHKAASACALLKKQGIRTLYYLNRGLSGWLSENLPVEKS